jgi:hypothetical protein
MILPQVIKIILTNFLEFIESQPHLKSFFESEHIGELGFFDSEGSIGKLTIELVLSSTVKLTLGHPMLKKISQWYQADSTATELDFGNQQKLLTLPAVFHLVKCSKTANHLRALFPLLTAVLTNNRLAIDEFISDLCKIPNFAFVFLSLEHLHEKVIITDQMNSVKDLFGRAILQTFDNVCYFSS